MGLLSVNACVGREVEMEERRKGTGERMVALGVEKERQQSPSVYACMTRY